MSWNSTSAMLPCRHVATVQSTRPVMILIGEPPDPAGRDPTTASRRACRAVPAAPSAAGVQVIGGDLRQLEPVNSHVETRLVVLPSSTGHRRSQCVATPALLHNARMYVCMPVTDARRLHAHATCGMNAAARQQAGF